MENHPVFKFLEFDICGLHKITPLKILNFYIKNKDHLANSMPLRPPEYYEENYWQNNIDHYPDEYLAGKVLKFVITHNKNMIGSIICDQIAKGPFQACFLGYALDKEYEGKGIMTGSLQCVIEYLFNNLKLNRIMANYIPTNRRSEKTLLNLNFEKEGFARKYLKINGIWQDHVLTSCINKDLV